LHISVVPLPFFLEKKNPSAKIDFYLPDCIPAYVHTWTKYFLGALKKIKIYKNAKTAIAQLLILPREIHAEGLLNSDAG
jgi:hypothetical protein